MLSALPSKTASCRKTQPRQSESTVLVFLVSALVTLLALLAVPLRIALVADPRAPAPIQVHASWLFGLVRGPLRTDATRASKTQKRAKRAKATKRRPMSVGQGIRLLRAIGGLERIRQLLRDLVASLHPNVDWLRIELGLGDPAETGQAWAVLGPVSAWLLFRYDGVVSVQPNFMDAAFAVEGRADFLVVPLQTLAIVVSYVASPRTLRGLYLAHREGSQ